MVNNIPNFPLIIQRVDITYLSQQLSTTAKIIQGAEYDRE